MKLKTRIVGVVPEGAPAYALSFEAKRKIAAPVSTLLGDGMACRVPDDAALEVMLDNVDHVVRVSEEEMRLAMKYYFTDTHNVVEGAGAAGAGRFALLRRSTRFKENVWAWWRPVAMSIMMCLPEFCWIKAPGPHPH